ncbi:hypothetical protein AB0L26_34075 [Streptomyces nondiastaticus]|uniref:DUF7878 domain-containing protein n=1 Tax=Streptomyces nondiastaticus TaxID=3154512 RepID=UPI00344819AB
MTLRLTCRDFAAPDLPRRGLAPQEILPAMLLADIEAELTCWDGDEALWTEEQFPVAELAHSLALRLRSPDAGARDFALDSVSADPGLVRIARSEDGWSVGFLFAPGVWSTPVAWEDLVAAAGQFVHAVREGVASIGIDPAFLPEV